LYELEQYANAVSALETEFLSLIDTVPSEERFYLYWTYNHLTGSWAQVESLQMQLELSVEAASDADEESMRTTLRDQAQFVRWELASAITDLEESMPGIRPVNHPWINESPVPCSPMSEPPSIVCGPISVRICHAPPTPNRIDAARR
jgi:hypothetical protein